jgi:hypothetical protein
LKDKGSDEVVFKAMGRAINKTVMIAELIKVLLFLVLANIIWELILVVCYCNSFAEEDCWSPPEYYHWIY